MFVIYVTATGQNVSSTDDINLVANPLPGHLSVKEVANPAAGFVWNTNTLDFVAPPLPRIISKRVFIQRFLLSEQKEMFGYNLTTKWTAANQKNIASIMRYLDFLDVIDLDDPTLVLGINFLETVSPAILGPGRAAIVLS